MKIIAQWIVTSNGALRTMVLTEQGYYLVQYWDALFGGIDWRQVSTDEAMSLIENQNIPDATKESY